MNDGDFMNCKFASRAAWSRRQAGLTLVELMISITLGLIVLLAATALLLSSKSAYTSLNDGAQLQDSARYAMENIARAIRQSAYENWDKGNSQDAPIVTMPTMTANLSGLDASSLKNDTSTPGIQSPLSASVNGSDVLAVRFFGSGPAATPDGSIIDCAGFGISEPVSQSTADADRGWSIYYVANDASGEPELRCKYHPDGGSSWNSAAIARGVESFQVLYGVASDDGSMPTQYLTATQINAKDAALVLTGATAALQAQDKNRKTWWKKVRVIKVAVLVRGSQSTRSDPLTTTYDLFGPDYSVANAANDTGAQILDANLATDTKNRSRKIFMSIIQVRNQAAGSGKEGGAS